MHVRTRIAPSPTGEELHIGNLYTALINYVWAKKHNGQFIVRIEDTDRVRYIEGSEKRILQSFSDYGLEYDEGPEREGVVGPYRQSERLETYRIYAKELIENGAAYYCICSKERLDELRKKQMADKKIPKYDKHCFRHQESAAAKIDGGAPHVIRLNVPADSDITFEDVVRGPITINSDNIDDQVLMKSDGYPTYHLAVVIDDHFMKITHVIRGEDWITSTPKHVLLYRAFGWELPVFAHMPLLRNPDKSKFSKRKNPVWASWYLRHGILPEAMLNYLALMGWSHPKQKEIFDIEEFTKVFELKNVQPVGPAFDPVKLEWINGEHIRALDPVPLQEKIISYYRTFHKQELPADIVQSTVPLTRERMKKLSDYLSLCAFFLHAPEKYEIEMKSYKSLLKKSADALGKLKSWKADAIGQTMQQVALDNKVKNSEYFMVMRVAVTGKKVSPPLNESMELLGKKECLSRLAT